MTKFFRYAAVFGTMLGASSVSYADEYLTYRQFGHPEQICNMGGRYFRVPVESKLARIKHYAGHIEADFDESMPVEVATCARLAVDIWEKYISTDSPVRIRFEYAPLPEYTDDDGHMLPVLLSSKVRFVHDEQADVCWPSSLCRQDKGNEADAEPDGVVTINSEAPWGFWHSLSYVPDERYNLTTGVMQAIANVLGFGSSVDWSGNLPKFMLPAPTPFDDLIHFGSHRMRDFGYEQGGESSRMADVIEAFHPAVNADDYIFIELPDNRKVYLCANRICDETPFNHICQGYPNLMTEGLIAGTMYQKVDGYTLSVLEQMGWRKASPGDISLRETNSESETGIAKGYEYEIVSVKPIIITHPKASVSYRKADGRYETYDAMYGLMHSHAFTVQDPGFGIEEADVNVNGDIYGYLDAFLIPLDPETREYMDPVGISYRLSIEKAPSILSVRNISSPENADEPYEAVLLVTYRGAEFLNVEASDALGRKYGRQEAQPYVAYVWVPDVDPSVRTDVDLTAVNSRGYDTYRFSIDPITAGAEMTVADGEVYDRVEIFDLGGRMVGHNPEALPKGVYVEVYYKDGNVVDRRKTVR